MIETYLGFMIGLIMILLLVEVTDDDDDQDGGMMVPAYQRPQQGSLFYCLLQIGQFLITVETISK